MEEPKKKRKAYGPTPKKFTPQNPDKYRGSYPIISRSSLETAAFLFFDRKPEIIQWGSESCVIPYFDPSTNTSRRYFPDLDFVLRDHRENVNKHFLVEIKPHCQCMPPGKPKGNPLLSKSYIEACKTYLRNNAKWKAAIAWTEKKGWHFGIWTERGLFGFDRAKNTLYRM